MIVQNGGGSTGEDKKYSDVAKFSFLYLSFLRGSLRKSLNTWWILLDNKSTAKVFCNRKLIQDIRHADENHIFVHCSDGSQKCTKETTLPVFRMVWFDEGGISNILAFGKVKEKLDVRYYQNE